MPKISSMIKVTVALPFHYYSGLLAWADRMGEHGLCLDLDDMMRWAIWDSCARVTFQ